jgi:hypothetical protein
MRCARFGMECGRDVSSFRDAVVAFCGSVSNDVEG